VYADYDPEEEIPLLFAENGTTTIRKTDKDLTGGIVITNKYIYYKLNPTLYKEAKANKIALSNLRSFKIKLRFFGWVYINTILY
jgi:hypothetical protein